MADDKQEKCTGAENAKNVEQEIETGADSEHNELEPEEPQDEMALLKKELSIAKEEVKLNYGQYLRVLAEADNYRKRMAREREEYVKYANLSLAKKIISIMDDLERALHLSREQQDFDQLYKGVDMIFKSLTEAVKAEGVEAIEAQGKMFNPEFHEPLIMEPNSDFESNMIIEELQKGYLMHGRVIRPSLVKVSE